MELRKLFYLLISLLLLTACETDEVSDSENNLVIGGEIQTSTESNNDSSSGNTQSTNISSITPQGFSIEAKDYSVNLSYTVNNDATSVNIYKGYCEDELNLIQNVSMGSDYLDLMTSVTDLNYYKISFVDANGNESNFSEVKSVSANEPLNPLKSQDVTSRPIGVHYADYHFNSERFTRLKQRFTIHELPTLQNGNEYDGGLYWNFYQGVINDNIGFYFGLQTLVYGDPDGTLSKGVIFSRWETRDTSNYRLAQNGWGQSAGYEGDFIGVRKEFEWGVGTYDIELKRVESDNEGDWYGLFIRNISDPSFTYIGSIRFEHGSNEGIRSGAGTWTEIYSANSSLEFPRWHVSIDDIRINDDEQPNRIQSRYFEEVWQSNQFDDYTNIYSPDGKEVHFLMGPYVKRFHESGNIVTTETLSSSSCFVYEDITADYSEILEEEGSFLNSISDFDRNFYDSILENVQALSPGPDMVPGTIELLDCSWAPLFSDNQGNLAGAVNASNQTMLLTHEGYITNIGMEDSTNDNKEFFHNFIGSNKSTLLIFPNFQNDNNITRFKSVVIDDYNNTITTSFDPSILGSTNIDQYDSMILFPGDYRFTTSEAVSIRSFIQDSTKKSIIVGLGWVWRDYYANGDADPMPLNLILEDLGARYYTITGRDLTYNIRGETVFFPSTIDITLEPINCSD